MKRLPYQQLKGYAVAILWIAVATLLCWLFPGALGMAPFLAFYPAVVLAAAFGGLGPGLFATAAAFLCVDLLLDETPGVIEFSNPVELVRFLTFLAGGIGTSVIAGMKRLLQERQLRQAREMARLIDMSDLGYLLVRDEHDRIIRWSAGCARLYGYTSEQALGRISHELLQTRFPQPLESIRRSLAQSGRWEGELTHTAADGGTVVVASLWVLRPGVSGAPGSVLEVNNDITEQKRVEERLRKEEQRLRATFNNAALGILEVDADGRILDANERICTMLGYRCGELVGRSVHELTAPEDQADSDRQNGELCEGRRDRIDYEKRCLRQDGSRIWVHVTVTAIRDADGGYLRSIGTVEDIQQRRAAEAQLRLQAEALEAAANGIIITDAQGKILWVNSALAQMTGYPVEELIGQTPRVLKSGKQDDAFYRNLWQTILLGRVWHGELVNRRKDGSQYHEEMTISPVKDESGRVTHFIAIKLDVTQRKRGEAELLAAKTSAEQAKRMAEEANRAKDHFLAVLSHELRTPLTPVLATASLLEQDRQLPSQHHDDIEMIRRNVELEARLIDDLLDVTRIVRGKIELDLRPVPLGQVVRRAAEVCLPDIEARRQEFGLDLGEAESVVIRADGARLQQAFWNLLKNAVKFTPRGGCVGIRCRVENGQAVVEVSDSGEGIDPAVLPTIFQPFEQGSRDVTRQFGGLGLGLTITRGLVEMHGGSITAHSGGKGMGATFIIRLPVLTPGRNRTPAPAHPDGDPADELRPLRILLVEDHGDTAKMMKRVLARAGHDVQIAGDVATALELASHRTFDLLVSDLGLPDGSGHDLMSELRRRGRHLPGIALSGYGQEQDIRRAREAGFAAHLTKPANPQRLAQTMARVMAASETPTA